MGRAGLAVGTALIGAVLAACNTYREFPLPSIGFVGACRGVGLDATLAGSPDDPRVVWLDPDRTRGPSKLVWPTNYKARFNPELEIINASGTVVLRQGDHISGGCVKGPEDDPASVLLIDGLS